MREIYKKHSFSIGGRLNSWAGSEWRQFGVGLFSDNPVCSWRQFSVQKKNSDLSSLYIFSVSSLSTRFLIYIKVVSHCFSFRHKGAAL